MPAVPVRVMVWNIEQLSDVKITIPGIMPAIAQVVANEDVDVLIVLEVRKTNVATIAETMSDSLNEADGGGTNWRGYFLSEETGLESYGLWIRDLNFLRPAVIDPSFGGPPGTAKKPLADLYQNRWKIYPSPDFGEDAYWAPLPQLPRFPLCDVFSGPNRPLRRRRQSFSGQPMAVGGFSLGNGYRLPSLPILVAWNAGTTTWIPIVVCHYAAVRGGRNHLGQGQVAQLNQLHIAQLFNSANQAYWLQYLDAADNPNVFPVEQLLYTGDFNLDFLENMNGGTNLQRTNRDAYNSLTPTQQGGGSALPPAAAGVSVLPPNMPYGPPWADPPPWDLVDDQALRAAVTTQGTILKIPLLAALPYVSAAFDNFIYGGAALNTAVLFGADSGVPINVPDFIIQPGAAGTGINLSATAAYYWPEWRRSVRLARALQRNVHVGPPLTPNDRLIGARLISDHLPVVMEFNVP